MPIGSRMRGGQMLFTQPQLREDVRYSQGMYLNSLYQRRRPQVPKYDDVKPIEPKGLARHNFQIAVEYNKVLDEAEQSAMNMNSIVSQAGDESKMNSEQRIAFNQEV